MIRNKEKKKVRVGDSLSLVMTGHFCQKKENEKKKV